MESLSNNDRQYLNQVMQLESQIIKLKEQNKSLSDALNGGTIKTHQEIIKNKREEDYQKYIEDNRPTDKASIIDNVAFNLKTYTYNTYRRNTGMKGAATAVLGTVALPIIAAASVPLSIGQAVKHGITKMKNKAFEWIKDKVLRNPLKSATKQFTKQENKVNKIEAEIEKLTKKAEKQEGIEQTLTNQKIAKKMKEIEILKNLLNISKQTIKDLANAQQMYKSQSDMSDRISDMGSERSMSSQLSRETSTFRLDTQENTRNDKLATKQVVNNISTIKQTDQTLQNTKSVISEAGDTRMSNVSNITFGADSKINVKQNTIQNTKSINDKTNVAENTVQNTKIKSQENASREAKPQIDKKDLNQSKIVEKPKTQIQQNTVANNHTTSFVEREKRQKQQTNVSNAVIR